MTAITRFSLTVTLILACALVCTAQEQSKESAANAAPTENAVGPINGEGTTGKIAKFTGANAIGNSVITESGTKIAVNFIAPVAHFQVHGPVLSSQSGNGTNATPLLQTSGGKGGNTTGAASGTQTAGAGASIFLTAGNGGDAAANNNRGVGGSITLQPGAPGGGAGLGGLSGNVLLAPTGSGRVGIGTTVVSLGKLQVEATNDDAIYGNSTNGIGVTGEGQVDGVLGSSPGGNGVNGYSPNGNAVYGNSVNGHAGYFDGKVQVNGNLFVSGVVCANNVSCVSDARLKQGVTNLNYGLNQVLRLRPVSWHWKTEPEGKLQLGLVAQEVESVMPELILREADATKPLGLNYMALLPVAVKAIQEQQEQIKQLQELVTRQQAQLLRQQAQLNRVKRIIEKRRAPVR